MILWLQKPLLVQLHPEVVHTDKNQRTWFEAGYSSPPRPKSTMARHPIWRLEPHMTLEEPLLKSNMEPLLTLSVGIKFEFWHLESSAQKVKCWQVGTATFWGAEWCWAAHKMAWGSQSNPRCKVPQRTSQESDICAPRLTIFLPKIADKWYSRNPEVWVAEAHYESLHRRGKSGVC